MSHRRYRKASGRPMDRRQFLKAGGAGLGVAAGFASNLAALNAFAADASGGYKALVCVFLRGGMDTHDMLIPFDLESSRAFEQIRAPFIDGYAQSRRNANLLDLGNSALADGREFAFPQEMQELRDLYLENNVAVVGNVGPLIEPLSTANLQSARIPARLFSHNDQQSTWMASSVEGAREGWGGRFGDFMLAANANRVASFTAVTTFGSSVFVNGFNVNGFNLSPAGGQMVDDLSRTFGGSGQYNDAMRRTLYGQNAQNLNFFHQDAGTIAGTAIDDNLLVSSTFAASPDPETDFPETTLGGQLRVVAKMIGARQALGLNRQIFFVADNGYDTHSNQTELLPQRQLEISQALGAFYQETEAMNLAESVTTFTASDFGRTLNPNNSGTDHGWGSHHLVMGGAVNGGQIFGNVPPPVLGHSQDDGRGRLIPEISIDQYATTLGRWFGLSASEVLQVFPNLNLQDPEALEGLLPNNGEVVTTTPPPEVSTGVLDRSNWRLAATISNGDTPNSVDGNANTRWTTFRRTQRPGQSFMIDMGSAQTFNRIVLDSTESPMDFPRGYNLLVSQDGNDFETIASGEGDSAVTSISFSTQNAQFVRIDQTGSSESFWWSIHDLNAFNT